MQNSRSDFGNHIFSQSLKQFYLPPEKTLLACSGGPDSILLFYLFLEYKKIHPPFSFSVFHLNHQMKDNLEYAKDSSEFIKKICHQNKITCYYREMNWETLKEKGSNEEIGRLIRYRHLYEIAETQKYDSITTAHHQDDQIETILMRLFTGTGLNGFLGMKSHTGILKKPLLSFTKKQIVDFLETHHLEYKIDPTNYQSNYLRNKIRNKIIPVIKEIFPSFSEKMLSLQDILEDKKEWIDSFLPDWEEEKWMMSLRVENLLTLPKTLWIDTLIKGLKHLRKGHYLSYKHSKVIEEQLEKKAINTNKIFYHKSGISLVTGYERIYWIDEEKRELEFNKIKEIVESLKNNNNKEQGFLNVKYLSKDLEIRAIQKTDILRFVPSRKVGKILGEKKIPVFERDFFVGVWKESLLIGIFNPTNKNLFIHKDYTSHIQFY